MVIFSSSIWKFGLPIVLAALLAGCGGGDNGADGFNGSDGRDAFSSLVRVDAETAGINCPTGGSRITAGLDVNRNNTLDATEVSQDRYVCNGVNGSSGSIGLRSLVINAPEPAGSNCNSGGISVRAGIDANGNNLLEPNEISHVDYVCNGRAGTQGLTSLLSTSNEAAGAICANGGTRFNVGLDLDGNNTLSAAEVTTSAYACNGANGTSGANGLNSLLALLPEPAGVNCPAGGTRVQSGLDSNRNNTLDTGEVTSTAYICTAVAPPSAPTSITLTYSAKTFNFSWATTSGATSYLLFEDPDGPGPASYSQVSGTITATTTTFAIPTLLHNKVNARYALQACNSGGCSANSAEVTPNLTQAIGYFKASNPDANDLFGVQVVLSADGTTLAIGAQGEASSATGGPADNSTASAGAVYVFTKTATGWAQQALLKAPNAGSNYFFGKVRALALSADGNTLAIGSDGEASNHTGTFTLMPAANTLAADSGAVYVFARAANTWSFQAYIKASNAQAFDLFGSAVSLSANGSVLAVGAWLEDSDATGVNGDETNDARSDSGAAYVFARTGTVWAQQSYLKAANAKVGDWFGLTIALSGDGSTLAVGAFSESSNSQANPNDTSAANAGAVYVFASTGSSWVQQAYLKASNPEADDRFGVSIALSNDGNTLAIGNHGDDSNTTGTFAVTPADNALAVNSGAVFVFSRTGSLWSQQAYIKASVLRAGDRFGRMVALSADGQTLAIGAALEDSSAVGVGGDAINGAAADSGAVYLMTRTGTSWSQRAYLKASNTQAGDNFGASIALSADGLTLAIGADREDSNAVGIGGAQTDNSLTNAGAVYLY